MLALGSPSAPVAWPAAAARLSAQPAVLGQRVFMEPGSSPACNVRCGWQEESDHEVSEPPWPSGSFLPITQDLTLFLSLIFSDHQHGALCEQQIRKSGQGLCWAPGRV